jgi:hypothetical protein
MASIHLCIIVLLLLSAFNEVYTSVDNASSTVSSSASFSHQSRAVFSFRVPNSALRNQERNVYGESEFFVPSCDKVCIESNSSWLERIKDATASIEDVLIRYLVYHIYGDYRRLFTVE